MAQLETYYYSDQPTTCPKCGSRTDILLDMSHTISMIQIEKCLSCGEPFMLQCEQF